MGIRLYIVLFAHLLIPVNAGLLPNSSSQHANRIGLSRQTLKLEPVPEDYSSPPPYMLHLYNRYRKGRPPQGTANTVRSFLPVQGKLGNRDVLVFNLTGIHPTEYIERADLHVHIKRSIRFSKEKKSSLKLNILDLSKLSVPEMDSISLPRISSGWHTLEITDSVISCLDGEIGSHHLMGLLPVEGEDLTKLLDISKLSSRPFLVVFSEDDDHMAIEDLGKRSRQMRKDSFENNSTFSRSNRVRREILDNELPDYPLSSGDNSAAEIQARLKHKPLDSPAVTYRDTVKNKMPKGKHRKRRRRRRRKEQRLPAVWGRGWWKAGGRRNEFDSTSEEGDEDRSDDVDSGINDDETCQRRELVVDLAAIGWSEWIISPNSFHAHYCAGLCTFPMKKAVHPSNHATIQSLVHALGLYANVPRPCCVPQDLSPLTLLYFDQDGNVVLKSYPSMIVESCACR